MKGHWIQLENGGTKHNKLDSRENGKSGQLRGNARQKYAKGEEQELNVKDGKGHAQPMVLRAFFLTFSLPTPVSQEGAAWK